MDPEKQMRLMPDDSGFPTVLSRCSIQENQSVVTVMGNPALLIGVLLEFFCSVRSPGDAFLKTYDLARALRSADVTTIGGFFSPMEKELDFIFNFDIKYRIGLGNLREERNEFHSEKEAGEGYLRWNRSPRLQSIAGVTPLCRNEPMMSM